MMYTLNIIKDIAIDIVQYGFATISIVLSILSFFNSRKSASMQERINRLEILIKQYQIEEINKKKEKEKSALVEARIYQVSKGKYKIKIWNSGGVNAYNVDFMVPENQKVNFIKMKSPYEVLEPGKSYEETVLVVFGTPPKVTVITAWQDDKGNQYTKENYLQVF